MSESSFTLVVYVEYVNILPTLPLFNVFQRKTMSQHEQYNVFNTLTDGVLIIEQNHTVVFANKKFLQMYDDEKGTIVGKKCFTALHNSIAPCTEGGVENSQCGHRQVFATGRSLVLKQHPHVLPDGTERILEISVSPLLDEKGDVSQIIHVTKDITDQERLREKLHLALVEQETIFNNSPYAVSYLDPELRVIKINAHMEKLIGKKNAEVQGKYCYEIWGQHAGESSKKGREKICDICRVQDAMADGQNYSYERRVGRKIVEVTASPVMDINGSVVGALETGKDITERKLAEEALEKSEAKYSYLFDNLNDAAFLIGRDGLFLEANAVAEKRLGYSREEFLRMSPLQIDAPQCGSAYKERLAEIQKTGKLFHETIHVTKDGREIPTEISACLIGLNGESCVLALARDITERKKGEEVLQQLTNRLHFLLATTPATIYTCKTSGDFDATFVSENVTKQLGYTPQDFTDTPGFWASHIHPEDAARAFAESQQLFEQGIYRHEYRFRTKDGRYLWVFDEMRLIRDAVGIPLEIVGYLIDITDRKHVEQELAKSKEEWERTFNSFTDIVTLQDLSMHIVKVNKAGCQILGLEQEKVIAHPCYELFHGSDEPCVGCPLLETRKDFQPYTKEMYHKKLDKTFLVSAAPVMSATGELEYIAHVAQDISDVKKLEQELYQAQKMEAIGTLAGGIAHDFNNILSGIIGYSQLIQREVPTDSAAGQDIIEVINAGRRAADLVRQILTFSRKTESKSLPLRPHLLVKEALKLLHATLPTTIRIEEDIDPDCGTILADPTNMHQVIVNLCTNALHAMSDEKGTLGVSLQHCEVSETDFEGENNVSAGPFIVLSVSDTGSGMEQSTIDHIFEPYYTTKEVGTGTGLGLAVIHGIVQDAQGFIRVKSEPGEGSTFAVYLPLLQEKSGARDASVDTAHLQGGHERILVVDDEAFLVRVTQRQLENLGYYVTGTTDSKDALEKIRTNPDGFDLLITDQTMPGLTGAELAIAVKEIKPTLPIILCTGHSSVLSQEQSQTIGIARYIGKPVIGNALSDAVREVLDEK